MFDQSTPDRSREGLDSAGSTTLRDLLNSIFFYRRPALMITLVIAALGIVIAVLLPPIYRARARVLTLNAGVYDMQPGTTTAPPVPDPTAAVNTEMQLLASAELHRAIAREELGPEATPDAVNRRVRQFESHLHISKLEAANVIELEYSDRSPDRAADELRRLLAGYFAERADVLTSGRVGFLTEQRDQVRAQLDKVDADIAAYEKENGVVDIAAQISGAVDLDDQLHQHQQEAEAALAESRKSVSVLIANSQGVPRQVELYSDNSEAAHTIGTMQATLLQLEAKRADLASRYMPGSPFVKQVEAQITELKAAIEAQKGDLQPARRTGYNAYHDTVEDRLIQAEAGLAGASARHSVLNSQVAASGDRLKALIAISDTLDRLHMQRGLLADTVKNYSAQLEQARIQQNQATTAGSTNVRVIEAPVPPSRRSNPLLLMIAASIVAAILIAAVAVLVLSSLRETFLSPEEAERGLLLPVLCDLPRRSNGNIPAYRDFSRLVAAINAAPSSGYGKVVLLLTPHPEPERDLTAKGLATALERRTPKRNVILRLDPPAGAAQSQAVATRSTNGVSMVTVDLGVSRQYLESLFRELRAAYDHVIVTAPPASSFFESVEISPLADVVFLLVQAEETRKAVAQAIIEQVANMGARIQGLVMTGRRYHIPAWIYGLVLDKRSAA